LLQAAHVLDQFDIAAGQQAGEDMLFFVGVVVGTGAAEEARISRALSRAASSRPDRPGGPAAC
jgi:hypothetical protein